MSVRARAAAWNNVAQQGVADAARRADEARQARAAHVNAEVAQGFTWQNEQLARERERFEAAMRTARERREAMGAAGYTDDTALDATFYDDDYCSAEIVSESSCSNESDPLTLDDIDPNGDSPRRMVGVRCKNAPHLTLCHLPSESWRDYMQRPDAKWLASRERMLPRHRRAVLALIRQLAE